jgi:hypothetical protein
LSCIHGRSASAFQAAPTARWGKAPSAGTTCAISAKRSGSRSCTNRGRYRSNPLVQDHGLSPSDAQLRDPPPNGKGGALLDGRLHRGFLGERQAQRLIPHTSLETHRRAPVRFPIQSPGSGSSEKTRHYWAVCTIVVWPPQPFRDRRLPTRAYDRARHSHIGRQPRRPKAT